MKKYLLVFLCGFLIGCEKTPENSTEQQAASIAPAEVTKPAEPCDAECAAEAAMKAACEAVSIEECNNTESKASNPTAQDDLAGLYGLERQMIEDAIEQYEIASRGGSEMDICVRAGVVAQTYLTIKRESGYRRWLDKATELCPKY